MPDQNEWRFCATCNGMFYNGYPEKGHCPAGGGHTAAGYDFVLPYDTPPGPHAQDMWRFCDRCHGLFFDGYPDKGRCPAGDGHRAAGFTFVLPHDVPGTPTAQTEWRYCGACHGMFYDGYPDKGPCPKTGGGHAAVGYGFVLPHRPDGHATPPVVTLRYTGMICFGETDHDQSSGSDEIYILTTAATIGNGQPVVRTERHPVGIGVYENVDKGGSWSGPLAACYHGPARDVSLVVTVMEHDEGDPEAYRGKIEAVVEGAALAAAAAGYPVPEWGRVLVADLVNAALDTGDDSLGSVALSFSTAQLLATADQPPLAERDVKHHWFTMHNGEGSTYKAYFDVVRA